VRRDGFLILGMHRSGTSAIAGTLVKLGVAAPKTLLGPNPSNPRGHWESVAFVVFHDELLASASSKWDDWQPFNLEWYRSHKSGVFRQRAKTLLRSEFGNNASFVLKDPRMCRLVPFWLEVCAEEGITPRLIMPIRSPIEVAQSLKHRAEFLKLRDGLSFQQNLQLWMRHVLDAELATRGLPRIIVDWNAFRADWRTSAKRIADVLNVELPRLSDADLSDIDEFLNLKSERDTSADPEPDSEVQTWALAAYQSLLELAERTDSKDVLDKLDDLHKRFERHCRSHQAPSWWSRLRQS
jgi:hypothetical protein